MPTAGEECQVAAKTLSAFADPRQGAITAPFINSAMGIAIFKGEGGVAIVRLRTGEWSAPCAITCKSADGNAVQPAQEMVLLFMRENAIFSLVGQTKFVFNETHQFAAGPLYGSALNLDGAVDVYCYVRFNNGFTPSELISQHMSGWAVMEDPGRHALWHGKNATWFDVLTNKISVDRSSVGNALYLVLNLASSGGTSSSQGKNFARIEEWSQSRLSAGQTSSSNQSLNQIPKSAQPNRSSNASNSNIGQNASYGNVNNTPSVPNVQGFDAQAAFEMQLKAQEQMRVQILQSQHGQQQTPQQQQQGLQQQNFSSFGHSQTFVPQQNQFQQIPQQQNFVPQQQNFVPQGYNIQQGQQQGYPMQYQQPGQQQSGYQQNSNFTGAQFGGGYQSQGQVQVGMIVGYDNQGRPIYQQQQ